MLDEIRRSEEEITETDAPRTAETVVGEAAEAVSAERIEPERKQPEARQPVEEARVVELMAGLVAEEPSMLPAIQWISFFSALVITAVGVVMILWGMAALIGSRTTGPIGAFGGAILLFFGAAAIAGAVWLTVRTLRQRGVL